MSIFLQAVIIFFARIADMSLSTVRTISLVKGERKLAAVLGFFEVMIYMLVLGNVVDNLDNPVLLFTYCFGFACGNLVGGFVENKLSMGRVCAQVFIKEEHIDVCNDLRAAGFGVTTFEGYGFNGKSYMLNIITDRKKIHELRKVIDDYDSNIFVSIMDIRSAQGGHFSKTITVTR